MGGHSHHKRPFTTGEFGCFLSHWCIYEKMARENISCALILEDDFEIAQNPKSDFKAHVGMRLRQAAKVEGGWDMLYLGCTLKEPNVAIPAPNLVDPGYAVWAVGYVLRRSGALKLLAAEGKFNMAPIDAYLSLLRGRPVFKPYWLHDRAQEYCNFIPGALEGELRGLACKPPLVVPLPSGIVLSDTAKARSKTQYIRDLPEDRAPCVVESRALEDFWKANSPSTPLWAKDSAVDKGQLRAFPAGMRVQIFGLQAKPEFNGLKGKLMEYESNKGRWIVRLDTTQKLLEIKPCNLKVC